MPGAPRAWSGPRLLSRRGYDRCQEPPGPSQPPVSSHGEGTTGARSPQGPVRPPSPLTEWVQRVPGSPKAQSGARLLSRSGCDRCQEPPGPGQAPVSSHGVGATGGLMPLPCLHSRGHSFLYLLIATDGMKGKKDR